MMISSLCSVPSLLYEGCSTPLQRKVIQAYTRLLREDTLLPWREGRPSNRRHCTISLWAPRGGMMVAWVYADRPTEFYLYSFNNPDGIRRTSGPYQL